MTLTTRRISRALFAGALTCFLFASDAATATGITIDTVLVGNAGNANDTTGFGAVSNDYRIGTTEVSNAQYAAFLNYKAASDPLALYNTSMGSGFGGITRSGSSPNFTYAVIAGRGNMPVNWVSWYDSIRFANWLNNGQLGGDTETGAYTLLGGTPTPTNGPSITRNAGATWFLTSEDEWYKAAYHKNDGVTGNYFDYPTSSDTVPIAEAPAGGSNSANYVTAVGDMTDVGAYISSDSLYGTFDQGGNLREWNEAFINGSFRRTRGGSFNDPSTDLLSSDPGPLTAPGSAGDVVGFRVATVPEPSTAVLASAGLIALLAYGWRRRRRA